MHTTKLFVDRFRRIACTPKGNYDIEARVYSSGGVTHTVVLRITREDGSLFHEDRQTFKTQDASAFAFARAEREVDEWVGLMQDEHFISNKH